MKTMTVSKFGIAAVALILLQFYCFSDADICNADDLRLPKDQNFCPENLMATSEGNLPCDEDVCDELSPQRCELSGGNEVDEPLINFTTQMCITNDPPSPNQVGIMFNWTLSAGQEEVTGLKILVYNSVDMPQIWILLNVNLTGQVDSENIKIFSTDCLASQRVEENRDYFVSVQVLPSEKRYQFPDPFSIKPDCSRPRLSQRSLCPAAPLKRPVSNGFCNGNVEVTVNSGFPPGVTTETKEFDVIVLICLKTEADNCRKKIKTVQVALADSEETKVNYEDVDPGVYEAKMAFATKYGRPCEGNFYNENGTSVVKRPPSIYLDARSICNQGVGVEVTVTANSHRSTDNEFRVTVILSGSGVNEGQDITRMSIVTTDTNTSLGITKVPFKGVSPGNYTISTRFEDEYYTKCSSDVTYELTVPDCPPSASIIPQMFTVNRATLKPTIPVVDFWDLYGKFILGVGILSIIISIIAFLLHQRWLKRKRKIVEQRKLTEDRGSSADGLSSIADTTVQESHLHRFLNDTGRGWSSQIDCTSTELKYNHQPTSADSGVPSDEFETQSWQENESIAFSV